MSCENRPMIPFDIASLTGNVNSLQKPQPTGIIGRIKKPNTAIFGAKIAKLSVGKVTLKTTPHSKVPKHTTLRASKYLLYLSSRKPWRNAPTSPLTMKMAPMRLHYVAEYPKLAKRSLTNDPKHEYVPYRKLKQMEIQIKLGLLINNLTSLRKLKVVLLYFIAACEGQYLGFSLKPIKTGTHIAEHIMACTKTSSHTFYFPVSGSSSSPSATQKGPIRIPTMQPMGSARLPKVVARALWSSENHRVAILLIASYKNGQNTATKACGIRKYIKFPVSFRTNHLSQHAPMIPIAETLKVMLRPITSRT